MKGSALYNEIRKALGPDAGREKRKRLGMTQVTGPRLTLGHRRFVRGEAPRMKNARIGTEHRRDLR